MILLWEKQIGFHKEKALVDLGPVLLFANLSLLVSAPLPWKNDSHD